MHVCTRACVRDLHENAEKKGGKNTIYVHTVDIIMSKRAESPSKPDPAGRLYGFEDDIATLPLVGGALFIGIDEFKDFIDTCVATTAQRVNYERIQMSLAGKKLDCDINSISAGLAARLVQRH